jgi:hypothetical protein
MADPTTPRVRVGFTVTRADISRWHVRCECLDNPYDVEALAPVLRSGRFGFDGREGVSSGPAGLDRREAAVVCAGSSSTLMNCPASASRRAVGSICPARQTSIHVSVATPPLEHCQEAVCDGAGVSSSDRKRVRYSLITIAPGSRHRRRAARATPPRAQTGYSGTMLHCQGYVRP